MVPPPDSDSDEFYTPTPSVFPIDNNEIHAPPEHHNRRSSSWLQENPAGDDDIQPGTVQSNRGDGDLVTHCNLIGSDAVPEERIEEIMEEKATEEMCKVRFLFLFSEEEDDYHQVCDATEEEGYGRANSPVMPRNNDTSCTFEDDVPQDSSIGRRGSIVRLTSPKGRLVVSPLNPYLSHKLRKRRPIKKWSLLEVETLRAAVEKHGTGNWADILRGNKDVFERRTPTNGEICASKMSNGLIT